MLLRRFGIGCIGFLLFPLFFLTLDCSQAATLLSDAPTSSTSRATAWFVRSDGGDRKQCTGKTDSAYRGKGMAQPCAFKHPYYLFTSDEYGNKQWIVMGGDTVVIRGGPYRMGFKGSRREDLWGSCPGDVFGCSMPPIPSGTADHPTHFLGENHGNCTKKTELFGGQALFIVVDLRGSKNVDMECIEITDHSQCALRGQGAPASDGCNNGKGPLLDFAANGIATNTETAGIELRDIDIHGLAGRGIIGPIGGNFTVDHVRIAFNEMSGWDFDDGSRAPKPAGAAVHASYLTVEWNGCDEEYPIRHAIPAVRCFDQSDGGYGDGIGTPDMPLNFACDHCIFRYNTQDGFDLLHTSGSQISVTNSTSYGNMGQQWKMGAMRSVLFQNNMTVNNCRRLSEAMAGTSDGYQRYLSMFCRAEGGGIVFAVTDGGSYIFQNNSFAGYGATSYGINCSGSCSNAKILFQNNLNVGYKDTATGKVAAVYYTSELPKNAKVDREHNIYYSMRSCPFGMTEHCDDPKVVRLPTWAGEASLDNIDLHLTSGSPARGAGVAIPNLTKDHDGVTRSTGGGVDIGAYQYHP